MNIEGMKISVIGAARSGIAAARLIKNYGGIPFVSDAEDNVNVKRVVNELSGEGIISEYGKHSDRVFDCSLMVISPGVPSDAEVVVKAKSKKIKIISEIELASQFFTGSIIAVTGTNGKTTTTSLCAHVFNTCGVKTYPAGNIGMAFSEVVQKTKPEDVVALEVSSFQLDFIDQFKPKVAVILNITPDHLNRYENKFENYIGSKTNIYKNQSNEDHLILNLDSKDIINNVKNEIARCYYFSLTQNVDNGCSLNGNEIAFSENGTKKFSCSTDDIYIRGPHNQANAMAVITAANIFKLDGDKIREGLRTFKGVEHRLELVRELEGVTYINDSKATNVDSVWYALNSFENPIFLILGGQDKGNDYSRIKSLVEKKVKKIFAIGSSAETVFNFFHSSVKVELKVTLEDAVLAANNEARKDDVILLSPACASFDMFDSYEHRGRIFKEAVNNL